MAGNEKTDIPNWVINAGEKIQRLENRLTLDGLSRWVVGSSSRSYLQARWNSVDQVINTVTNQSTTLLNAEADPDASLLTVLPRFKRKAVVINAPWSQMDELLDNYEGGEPSVAYSYKGKAHAGTFPGGKEDLVKSITQNYYSAALRTGRKDFGAGLGLWIPKDRIFLRAMNDHLTQNVPIEELHPNIPLL